MMQADTMRLSFPQLLTSTALISSAIFGQDAAHPQGKPQDTEVWEPVPKVVTPGATNSAAPSDAIVLFDGTRPMMTTDLKLKNNGTLIVGGPRYEQGMMIISIGASTGGSPPMQAQATPPGDATSR